MPYLVSLPDVHLPFQIIEYSGRLGQLSTTIFCVLKLECGEFTAAEPAYNDNTESSIP